MISNKITFRLHERRNCHRKSGTEWALNAQLVGHDPWTLIAWENKPSDNVVTESKILIMRAFEYYHRHLQIPCFAIKEVNEDKND